MTPDTPANPAPSAADNNGEDYRQPDHREHPETRTDVTNTTPATYADDLYAALNATKAALAAAQATAREAMEEADHYKRIFKSNGASMELMVSRIPTGGQVIDAVIRAAAVTADSPGVLVWSANAAEQIEAALAKIAEEGQAQP